jgi:hypothetical protein
MEIHDLAVVAPLFQEVALLPTSVLVWVVPCRDQPIASCCDEVGSEHVGHVVFRWHVEHRRHGGLRGHAICEFAGEVGLDVLASVFPVLRGTGRAGDEWNILVEEQTAARQAP